MIDALFNQPNLLAMKRLLDLTTLRQEAIAANLANVETPNYRRVDVAPQFEAQLKAAIASRDLERLRTMEPGIGVDPSATPRRRDGNTVDLEGELVRLNRNSLEHSVETHFLTGALLKLRHAITGRTA
jgi:flagellar basal-body rod protein FlgB